MLSKTDSNGFADLEARVELNAGDHIVSWDANVSRSGGQVDAQTQSHQRKYV